MSGELSPVFGTKQTEETRQRRSKAAKARGNNRTGYKHSEETKRKISESRRRKK